MLWHKRVMWGIEKSAVRFCMWSWHQIWNLVFQMWRPSGRQGDETLTPRPNVGYCGKTVPCDTSLETSWGAKFEFRNIFSQAQPIRTWRLRPWCHYCFRVVASILFSWVLQTNDRYQKSIWNRGTERKGQVQDLIARLALMAKSWHKFACFSRSRT